MPRKRARSSVGPGGPLGKSPLGWAVLLCLLPSVVSAGPWTLPRGAQWGKVAGLYQLADEYYASSAAVLPDGTGVNEGDRRPYDDEGSSRQRSLWFETEYGVTDRWTAGAQIGWMDVTYEDRIQQTNSHGWSDLRLKSRVALLTGAHRVSVRTLLKLPTGRFSPEPGRIPLGENQTDLELGLQWGTSLGRPLSWVAAEASRRFRFRDSEFDFEPGDESLWSVEAGWGFDARGRTGLKASWRGVRGDEESLIFFAPGLNLGRDLDQIEVTLLFDLPLVFVEVGWTHTLTSETYPAAPTWSLAFSRQIEWMD